MDTMKAKSYKIRLNVLPLCCLDIGIDAPTHRIRSFFFIVRLRINRITILFDAFVIDTSQPYKHHRIIIIIIDDDIDENLKPTKSQKKEEKNENELIAIDTLFRGKHINSVWGTDELNDVVGINCMWSNYCMWKGIKEKQIISTKHSLLWSKDAKRK